MKYAKGLKRHKDAKVKTRKSDEERYRCTMKGGYVNRIRRQCHWGGYWQRDHGVKSDFPFSFPVNMNSKLIKVNILNGSQMILLISRAVQTVHQCMVVKKVFAEEKEEMKGRTEREGKGSVEKLEL